MKDLKSIKLTKLDRVRLEERKMSYLVGGDRMHYDGPPNEGLCNCGCYYANSGGSSTESNSETNDTHKFTSYSTPAEYPHIITIKI